MVRPNSWIRVTCRNELRTLFQFDSVPNATVVRCLETEPNGVIIGLWYSGKLEGSSIVNSHCVVLIATELTVLNRLRSKTTQVHCFSPITPVPPTAPVYENFVHSTSKLQHPRCPGDMETFHIILTHFFLFGRYKARISAGIPATVIDGFRGFIQCKQMSFRIWCKCDRAPYI